MKLYEVWEGDLYWGIFWEDEVNVMLEENPCLHVTCIDD